MLAERLQSVGAHGSSGADTTSVATIKSVSLVMLWSVFVKQSGPSARPISIQRVSQENTRAEQYSQGRDYFDHRLAPRLEMPGRAASRK